MADVGRILRERLGPAPRQGPDPRRAEPADPRDGRVRPERAHRSSATSAESPAYTAEKAKTTLGWQPRPVEDSIADTAESLIERGLAGSGSR